MDQPGKSPQAKEEVSRAVANLVMFTVFLIIVGIGIWLTFALDDTRRLDNCVAQGRRNCMPIEVPPR
jgi:hypothetical protein